MAEFFIRVSRSFHSPPKDQGFGHPFSRPFLLERGSRLQRWEPCCSQPRQPATFNGWRSFFCPMMIVRGHVIEWGTWLCSKIDPNLVTFWSMLGLASGTSVKKKLRRALCLFSRPFLLERGSRRQGWEPCCSQPRQPATFNGWQSFFGPMMLVRGHVIEWGTWLCSKIAPNLVTFWYIFWLASGTSVAKKL